MRKALKTDDENKKIMRFIENNPLIKQALSEAIHDKYASLSDEPDLIGFANTFLNHLKGNLSHCVGFITTEDKINNAFISTKTLVAQEIGQGDFLTVLALSKKWVENPVSHYKSEHSASSALRRMLSNKQMIGLKQGSGDKSPWSIPTYQFNDKTNNIIDGVSDICKSFGDNSYAVHQFMTIPAHHLDTDYSLANGVADLSLSYFVSANGQISIDSVFTPLYEKLPVMPRVGLHAELKGEFDQINWFGRGPHENYADRKESAAVGVYQSSVDEQIHDYARPQESGTKSDIRWVDITNQSGVGLHVTSDQLFAFSAVPLAKFDLYKSKEQPKHSANVEFKDITSLKLDYLHMGVGGDNGWGAKPHKEFMIPAKAYHYSFTLKPVVKPVISK